MTPASSFRVGRRQVRSGQLPFPKAAAPVDTVTQKEDAVCGPSTEAARETSLPAPGSQDLQDLERRRISVAEPRWWWGFVGQSWQTRVRPNTAYPALSPLEPKKGSMSATHGLIPVNEATAPSQGQESLWDL